MQYILDIGELGADDTTGQALRIFRGHVITPGVPERLTVRPGPVRDLLHNEGRATQGCEGVILPS